MLNQKNAVPLCSVIGVLLGAILAVAGGYLFGTGMIFEYIIYIFVGVIGGGVIGGVTGAAIAPRLSGRSENSAFGQLLGGVVRIVIGLFVLGLGGALFAALSGPGGRGPGRMPKIAALLYDLFGKWGVLLGMGAIGIVLIVFGVRVLLGYSKESEDDE